MKPIILDTKWVRPLDSALGSEVCMTCLKKNAKWAVGKPESGYLSCARCFLYTSPWGVENLDQIRDFVSNVEEAMGRSISFDGVVVENEADRILSSIVMISGISRSRAQRKMGNEGTGA